GAGPRGARGRPRGAGPAAPLPLAGQRPRAAKRPQAGAAAGQRHAAAAGLPARTPRRRRPRPRDARGGAEPGGAHTQEADAGNPRPLRRDAPPAGPGVAAPRAGVCRREPAPGGPPAGDRPADATGETPRPRAPARRGDGGRGHPALERPDSTARSRFALVARPCLPWATVPARVARNLPRHGPESPGWLRLPSAASRFGSLRKLRSAISTP